MSLDLAPFRMANGKLASHTSLGCYPLIYLTHRCEVLCAACADVCDPDDPIVAADVYWEGPPETCADCNREIPSAYGDPDAPDDDAP